MKVITIVFLLALVGCIEVKDIKEKSPESAQQDRKFNYRIEPLAQPQRYLVYFLGVECEAKFKKTTPQKKVEIGVLSHCTDVVNESGTHTYILGTQTLTVDVPEDLVIENKILISQLPIMTISDQKDLGFQLKFDGRIFFKRGAQLITEGKKILIDAQVIESEGAEIISFEPAQKAAFNQNGRSGGVIWIKAQELKGSIRFVLRGERGGDGENHFITRKKVHDLNLEGGHGGNSGRVHIEVQNLQNSLLQIAVIPGLKGEGTEVKSSCFFIQNCQEQLIRPKGKSGFDGLPERSCILRNNVCSEDFQKIELIE